MRPIIGAVLASTLLFALIVVTPTDAAFPGANGKIAFVTANTSGSRAQIWVINANGNGLRRLVKAGTEPEWSANGRKLAFTSLAVKKSGLYTVNGQGKQRRRVTNSGAVDTQPTWSPNGRFLALAGGSFIRPGI